MASHSTTTSNASGFSAISATHPPGGGPFSFFAANFYPIERGARRGQRKNNFLPGKTSYASRWRGRLDGIRQSTIQKQTQSKGETSAPLIADDRNFYKVEKWMKDRSKGRPHALCREQPE